MLYDVHVNLSEDEIKNLKFLLGPKVISKREKEHIKTGTDLFEILEEKDVFSESNLSPLKELLTGIKRFDLVKEVSEYEKKNTRYRICQYFSVPFFMCLMFIFLVILQVEIVILFYRNS